LLKFTIYQQKAVEEGHSEQSAMSMSTASYNATCDDGSTIPCFEGFCLDICLLHPLFCALARVVLTDFDPSPAMTRVDGDQELVVCSCASRDEPPALQTSTCNELNLFLVQLYKLSH
jgi:hypothetical protein